MPKRVDENQKRFVEHLRRYGATVQHLHEVGKGCPDILVGYRGINYLFEIKNPDMPPSKQRLTEDEVKWHNSWQGRVYIVKDVDEAFRIMNFRYVGD